MARPCTWRTPGRWASGIRVSLDEELLACVKRRAGLELDLGHHAELAGELRRLSGRHPLDEVLVGYEMTALYRSGRQADALALYRQVRDRLHDAQGIEPGPELAELHRRILNHDVPPPKATPRRRSAAPASPAVIPAPARAFVGRAEELSVLTAARPGPALVSVITGMPGAGKTRLAVEAARRLAGSYPDGQLFLEFHAHQAGAAPLGTDEALRRLLEMAGAGQPPLPQHRRELSALWQGELAGQPAHRRPR